MAEWRTIARVQIAPKINVWIRVLDNTSGDFDPVDEVTTQTSVLARLAKLLRRIIREQEP